MENKEKKASFLLTLTLSSVITIISIFVIALVLYMVDSRIEISRTEQEIRLIEAETDAQIRIIQAERERE
jgi:hypothetical protein